jgi:ribosomal protein S4
MAGVNFLVLLESRLDNLVYRMGFARTRAAARQLVNHGHIEVNGKKVDIPSAEIKPGSVIALREKDRNLAVVNDALEATISTPAFVDVDKDEHIIAYAKLESDEATDGYEDFVLELDYRDLTRTPKYIVISACASYLGDYFTGGVGSLMFIDEFEFVY